MAIEQVALNACELEQRRAQHALETHPPAHSQSTGVSSVAVTAPSHPNAACKSSAKQPAQMQRIMHGAYFNELNTLQATAEAMRQQLPAQWPAAVVSGRACPACGRLLVLL